jgi:threonine dehydrogenase-like Zn-dependent dehydrogenase
MEVTQRPTSANREQVSARDDRDHYTWYCPVLHLGHTYDAVMLTLSTPTIRSIVMGAGISGMAVAIQLKRHFGLEDVLV